MTAPTPPEVLREQVAAALWEAQQGVSVTPWTELSTLSPTRDQYRRLADAALAVFRDQQDPAVQRVLALASELDSKSPQASAWHVATRIRAAIGGDGR